MTTAYTPATIDFSGNFARKGIRNREKEDSSSIKLANLLFIQLSHHPRPRFLCIRYVLCWLLLVVIVRGTWMDGVNLFHALTVFSVVFHSGNRDPAT